MDSQQNWKNQLQSAYGKSPCSTHQIHNKIKDGLVTSTVSVKISPLIQKELQLLNIKKTFSTGSEVGLKLKLIHPK